MRGSGIGASAIILLSLATGCSDDEPEKPASESGATASESPEEFAERLLTAIGCLPFAVDSKTQGDLPSSQFACGGDLDGGYREGYLYLFDSNGALTTFVSGWGGTSWNLVQDEEDLWVFAGVTSQEAMTAAAIDQGGSLVSP